MKIHCAHDKVVKLSDLKPHPKNRNKHPKEQIDRLAQILSYQGWRYPIKISNLSGFITSGHGRLLAALTNGWTEAPVNYQDYDSEEQEYADVQADNAIASWAELDLSSINKDLPDFGPDFDIDLLGIKDFVLDLSEKESSEEDSEEEEEPPLPPVPLIPKAKLGDVFQLGDHRVRCMDSMEAFRDLPDNSIDSVVTDPPYGWRFMGKSWDGEDIENSVKQPKDTLKEYSDGQVRRERLGLDTASQHAGLYDLSVTGNTSFQNFSEKWAKEAFRVLKPGGHMLVFCGPRTYHRMATGVEDAGFEVRDQLQWLFGSGFPKSLDISKAIDKAAGAEREVTERQSGPVPGSHGGSGKYGHGEEGNITAPSTDAAKQWDGWGTALKPANEPILLARKPISEKTVAANVLKWGTGGLNIDACRIGLSAGEDIQKLSARSVGSPGFQNEYVGGNGGGGLPPGWNCTRGRFPANLILDETAAAMLDEQTGELVSKWGKQKTKHHGESSMFGLGVPDDVNKYSGDTGGASRFFYVAKSSTSEKNAGLDEPELDKNFHPTVKPLKLMSYLIRMVTPPNGKVLELFGGSGSTLIGCEKESVACELSEIDPAYVHLIIERWEGITNKEAIREDGVRWSELSSVVS